MKNHTKWALAGAAVVAVSLVSLQQTGALWSDSVTSDGTTITAGVLDLSAGSEGQKDFPFSSFAKADMNPGDYVQVPMVLLNSGNVGLSYALSTVSQSDPTVPLNLTVTEVADEAACGAGNEPAGDLLYDAPMHGATTAASATQTHVAPGGQAVLCFRATMGQFQQEQSTDASMVFTAEVSR